MMFSYALPISRTLLIRGRLRRLSLTLMLATGFLPVIGCGRSAQDHARFAQAGSTYAAALDDLLVVAGDVDIDAHSAKLLQTRAAGTVPDAALKQFADEDKARLETIGRLRTHARLLADYFGRLNDLATSGAPADASKAVEGTVAALSTVGKELRDPNLTKLSADQSKFGVVTNLIVSSAIRGKLNAELKARQQTIRQELQTQEVLLKALSDDINQNVQVSANIREDLLVDTPLKAGVPASQFDAWIAMRRSVLEAPGTVKQLGVASDDVHKLREVFEDLLQNKLNRQRIDSIITDFSSLLSVAEALKKSSGGK
ncbi:MAG: hypothetical protein JWL77_1542 [Chthonomonadaceae bacterium]|nr:hypothetical protein [Chthonomonadaceae bacterium]